jgi:LacI family transcriptional regulator
MNLEDIARRAGVSRSTVSRVINNEPYVSSRTREKVLKIIQEVGFTPNPGARMLVTQRTQVIGVVIPRNLSVVFEDPYYFPTLLQGVAGAAQERDYATLLWLGSSDEDEDRFYQRVLKNRLMDGLLIASATPNPSIFEHLLAQQIPFVTTERPFFYSDQISYVTIDNIGAGRTATEHLINLGRKRVGTIAGQQDNVDAQDRVIGYREALRAAGLEVDPDLIVEGYFSRRGGYLAMKTLLRQEIDGVVAASDTMAVGALQALQEAGVRVPEDVALVGFDDLPLAIMTEPTLTTIRQPISQRGYQATALLLAMLAGEVEGPRQVLLPTQLVIRQSTGVLTL